MKRILSTLTIGCTALITLGAAHAADVEINGEWVLLGDVAPVAGEAASKAIAAAPLPGQRLPLSEAFIEMQASAAGFPVDLPADTTIWVTRAATSEPMQAAVQTASSATPVSMPDDLDGLVPVLNVDVRTGEAITPDMISFEVPDDERRIQGLIRSASYLKDTEASRTIRAGQMLSMRDVQPVSVIRKGDPVSLVYEAGALRLTVAAKALHDASRGSTVRVTNLQSKRTMDAIAVAPGEARVGSTGL